MGQYRKKPVVIEAVQYTGNNEEEIYAFCADVQYQQMSMAGTFIIKTLEGNMEVKRGDYIIKGVNGEFYPCKPDIFAKTYEEVKEESAGFTGKTE